MSNDNPALLSYEVVPCICRIDDDENSESESEYRPFGSATPSTSGAASAAPPPPPEVQLRQRPNGAASSVLFDPHHHREDSLKKELVRMSTGPASMNDYAGLSDEHEEWLQQRNDVSEWLDRQVPVSDDHIPLLLSQRQPQS